MVKYPSKLLILVCLTISVVSVFYILHNQETQSQKYLPSTSHEPAYAPPMAIATSPQETTIEAPDGKNKLIMKEEKGKETTTYTFSIQDKMSWVSKEVFTKTVPLGTYISIPFNTFSPDNKYIFLQEGNTYFVPLKDGVLDINSLFAAKHPDYTIADVTGWGGMTLLVVNTNKVNGDQGPSFWFDVTSKSFIQLSSHFN